MALQSKVHRLHGSFHNFAAGECAQPKPLEEDGVLAVVSGRVRCTVEEETVTLRASDGLSIPAQTPFALEALDASVVYLYSEKSGGEIPFGV